MYRNISLLKDELNHNMTMAVLPVTIFIGVEAFVGLFGNLLILLIYSKRYKQSNFRSIVLSLAIVDLTSCCTTLPGEIFSQLNWYHYEYGWICKVKSYFNIFTAWSSASILLILAFDRYRKICRPLAWQIFPSLAWQMCGISFILSALVSVPVTIFWGKQTYIHEIDGYNISVSVCEKSDQYADGIYPLVYIGSVYVLPVSLMIFVAGSLNFITARQLFGHDVTFEARSRRLSISATTLTSLSFATDLANFVGNATSQNNNSMHLQPNGNDNLLTKQLSVDSRKSIVADDSCANIDLTSVTRTTKHTISNKKLSFLVLEPSDKLSDSVTANFASINETVLTRNGNLSVDTGSGRVSVDNGSDKVSIDTVSDKESDATRNRDTGNVTAGAIAESDGDRATTGYDKVNKSTVNDPEILDSSRNCNANTCNENNYSCSSGASDGNSESLHHELEDKVSLPKRLKSRFHHWQKTIIMLVLTTLFVFTMTTYVILTSLVAKPDGILKHLQNSQKVVFFFFWRLYFVNSVVNPILYGFMDPRFRSGFLSFIPCCKPRKKKISRAATSVMH